jgi:hypothetical protein
VSKTIGLVAVAYGVTGETKVEVAGAVPEEGNTPYR